MSSTQNNNILSVEEQAAKWAAFDKSMADLEQEDGDSESTAMMPTTNLSDTTKGLSTESAVAQPSAQDIAKYGSLAPFALDDVKLSQKPDQPTVKGLRNIDTALIGVGNIKTTELGSKQIRDWANKFGIKIRATKKAEVCMALAEYVKKQREMLQRGVDSQAPEQIFARGRINYVRAINVFALDQFKAKLVNRGTQLTRVELDEGVAADESLWKDFASLYNNGNDTRLSQLKWEVDWNIVPDPNSFTTIDWKKGEAAYKSMCAKYDESHKIWKRSGFHDGFEAVPFENFARVQWLVYLHQFLEENPGLLQTITQDLEEDAFFESNTGEHDMDTTPATRKRKASTAKRSSGKKRVPSKDEQTEILRSMAASSQQNAAAAASRSQAVTYTSLTMARNTIQKAIDEAKIKKRTAQAKLKKHDFVDNNNSRARKIVSTLKKKKVEMEPSPAKSDVAYSQSTTMSIRNLGSWDTVTGYAEDILDADKEIEFQQDEKKRLDDRLGSLKDDQQDK